MTSRLRRRMMVGIVCAVLVWPLMHGVLVAHYRVDPWELFGWAMYSLPAARVQIRVDVERGEELDPLRWMGEDRRRIAAFARRRSALGDLASAEPLARSVLVADAKIDAVTIETREIRLDRVSTRLVTRDRRERFERGALR